MRVVVPAVPHMLHPDVVPAITAAGYVAEVHPVDAHPFKYADLIRQLFTGQDDICFVEHDVVVTKTMLQELEQCPGVWCTNPYNGGGETLLGCTRFRIGAMPRINVPEAPWIELDGVLFGQVHEMGYQVHRHRPSPEHHHGWAY